MYVLPTPSPHGCFESRFSYHRPQCFYIDSHSETNLATSLASYFNFPEPCSKSAFKSHQCWTVKPNTVVFNGDSS